MKGVIKAYLILVLLLVLALNAFALSASIGNARMILYPEIAPGETVTIERTILVRNINNVSVLIHLDPFEELENMTEILDNDFVLEPLQEKDARFRLTIEEPGRYEGSIAVSFAPAEDPQGSGVGLLSNIIVIAREANETTQTNQTTQVNQTQPDEESKSIANPLVGLGIIVIIIAIGLAVFKFLKRGKHEIKKPKKNKR